MKCHRVGFAVQIRQLLERRRARAHQTSGPKLTETRRQFRSVSKRFRAFLVNRTPGLDGNPGGCLAKLKCAHRHSGVSYASVRSQAHEWCILASSACCHVLHCHPPRRRIKLVGRSNSSEFGRPICVNILWLRLLRGHSRARIHISAQY
jgi:hypothetical protein